MARPEKIIEIEVARLKRDSHPTQSKRSFSSVTLPSSYIEVGVAKLPRSERVVRFYSIRDVRLHPSHYETIIRLYQKTYGSEFQPVPDVSQWIIALDDQSGICLGSIAVTKVHDSAAPFILHGTPKGGADVLITDLYKKVQDEHDFELDEKNECCEAGTFTVNSEVLDSYDMLNLARLILWEIALHTHVSGYTNSIFVATKRVRLLLTRIGVWFWPFRPASAVLMTKLTLLTRFANG